MNPSEEDIVNGARFMVVSGVREGCVVESTRNGTDGDNDAHITVVDNRSAVNKDSDRCRIGASGYAKLHRLKIMGNAVRQRPNTEKSWSFHSATIHDVDFETMANDTSRQNPLLLIERGEDRFVVIHKSLVTKAVVIGIDLPPDIDELPVKGTHSGVFKIGNQFADWVDWAKAVKAASWPKERRDKQTVTVHVANV